MGRMMRVGAGRAPWGSLLLASLLVGCSGSAGTASSSAPVASAGQVSDRVMAPGMVEPFGSELKLSAAEAGRVARILVEEGQKVEAGALLAVLDNEAQLAALESARADVADAEALLMKARNGATAQERAQLKAERDAAAARAALSREDAARNDRLKERAAVTQAEWDRSRRQAEADAASAAALDARYQQLMNGTRQEDVASSQARLLAAKGRLAQAEAALTRREVRAPQAATVLWSRYRPGEYFNPGGESLFVLGDVSHYQVRADADEIDVSRVQVGKTVKVRTDTAAQPVAEGKVVWVSPRMGRKNLTTEAPTARGDTRIREVLVDVPAVPELLPGMRVWAEILP